MRHLIILLLLLTAGCGPTAIVDRMPNGNPILIRSPQPSANDIEELRHKYKLKTVVNLRGERLEDWYLEESLACAENAITLINIRASGRHPPSDEEIQEFLQLVRDPSNYPILVHCQGGIHRTGAYIALYRLMIQKWEPQRVLQELEENYFDWTVEDREAIKDWIRNFQAP